MCRKEILNPSQNCIHRFSGSRGWGGVSFGVALGGGWGVVRFLGQGDFFESLGGFSPLVIWDFFHPQKNLCIYISEINMALMICQSYSFNMKKMWRVHMEGFFQNSLKMLIIKHLNINFLSFTETHVYRVLTSTS